MNTVLSVGVFLVGPLRSLSLSFTALPIEMFFLTNVEFTDVGRRAGGRPLSLGAPNLICPGCQHTVGSSGISYLQYQV